MVPVIFHRLAAKEFRNARDWYAARSADVAARFRAAVDRAVNRAASQPALHPVLSDNTDLFALDDFHT